MKTAQNPLELPKAPRWISTEAGQRAWLEHTDWRGVATHALSVHERQRLLHEAEQLLVAREAAA